VFVNPDFEEAVRFRMRYFVLCLLHFSDWRFLLGVCIGLCL